MSFDRKPFVHVALLAAIVLAAPSAPSAQVPGPDRIEVVQTGDGPRVRLAGVARGTPFAEAAERLGGAGTVNAFFGGAGPIFRRGEIDGLSCSMSVITAGASSGDAENVEDVLLACEGGRFALWRLARRFRAALASLPIQELSGKTWYGSYPIGASVQVVPAEEGSWWEELLGPQELRVSIR